MHDSTVGERAKKRKRTLAVLQIGSKHRLSKRAQGVVEKGLLRRRRDCVDAAERQAEQAVVVGVRSELARYLLGCLNGLGIDCEAANSDDVGVDVAAGRAAVAVRDFPGRT